MTKGPNIPGVMIKKNGEYLYGGDRPLIEDLDSLPFPALQDLNLKKYYFVFQKKSPLSNIITSRGCPYNCTFCFHGVHGFKWRYRSPKNVFEEMKWQVEDLGVNELCIWDDNFTLDLERTNKILQLIVKNKLKFVWQLTNGIRVDRVSRNLIVNMKKAGCWSIVIAPETGDPFTIKKIQKGFTLDRVRIVNDWCKELKIFTYVYFMLGFPFETMKHAMNTYNFIREIKPEMISVHKFYPFPNTPISMEYDLQSYENKDYRSAHMTKEFERLYRRIYYSFYANPRNFIKIINRVGLYYTIRGYYKYFSRVFMGFFRNRDYLIKND